MEFKRGLIDKQQQGQLSTVFQKFDEDNKESLTWEQFKEFVFAIGMQFLVKYYSADIEEKLFEGAFRSNRVTFPAFMIYIEESCKYENGPEQFEKYMSVFDEDRNG